MTLDPRLIEFWNEILGGSAERVRTPWGLVVADPRFPHVWDANHAAVMEDSADLSAADIRAVLLPMLGEAGAYHEHIEFWAPDERSPALRELRETRPDSRPDVLMVFEGAPRIAQPQGVLVEELLHPDDSFWTWYRRTRNEFGQELSEEVIDEMVRRDREVFLPLGLRWFVASIDGELAGFTSLIAASGVGYLDNVVTMPEYRRRGVATATVTRAVAASSDAGHSILHLLAEEGSRPQALYERMGFEVRSRVESFTTPLPPGKGGRRDQPEDR